MSFLEDLLQAGTGYAMGEKGIESARDIGQRGYEEAMGLAEEATGKAKFQPFTVMTGTGTATTTPEGGYTLDLSPEQQAMATRLFGQAGSMFDVASADPTQATADIYENIRALQRPEEQRERLALEERMLSQGRMGLQSAAYGGSSPELLAQEQALAEARLKAGLGAREAAMAERKQAFDLGTGLFKESYLPQVMGLEALGLGIEGGKLAEVGRRTGAELFGRLGQSGVEALIQGEDLASRLQQQQMQSIADAIFGRQPTMQEQILGQIYDVDTSGGSSLLGGLGGLLSGLFGEDDDVAPREEEGINNIDAVLKELMG